MAFCVKCGKELPEESAVCPFCGSLQGPVDNESDNIPENDKGPKKGKKILRIIVFAISIFIFSELVKFLIIFLGDWFTAWSPERAQNATQAYLDYIFKGDIEHYAEAVGISADVLALQLDEYEEHRASNLIGDEIPVTDTIRENYADFFRNLEKKARYSVGDAVKTDEGFEVQVFVEPIISLANGEFTVLDLLINDSISDAELNERIYTQELELMEQLTAEPAYGDKAEFTVHIAKYECLT